MGNRQNLPPARNQNTKPLNQPHRNLQLSNPQSDTFTEKNLRGLAKGDKIRVIHGVVTINGTIRQPHHAMNQAPAAAGAGQPATAPEPKPEGGDNAQPESKERSR
jgi:hypothetical protein